MLILHRSNIVWFAWLAFMAGVCHIPLIYIYVVSGCITAISSSWKRWLVIPSLVGCGLIGQWHYDSYVVPSSWQTGDYFSGVVQVVRLPTLHDTDQRLVVQTQQQARIQIDTSTYPAYNYGDELQLNCQIRLPGQIEDFAYDKYLARYHITALCDQAKLSLINTNQGNPQIAKIYIWRNNLQQRVEQLWQEPAAALILGVLIGEQDTIPDHINTIFRQSGTVHILVVSGMHVLIIIQLLTAITKWLPRGYQTAVILILLGAFCILTGLSATVIRAVIMGSIPLTGRLVGRPSKILFALTWAAGIMTVANPYILVHDVGFQLSFLATLGLVYGTPLIQPLTKWLPETFLLRETVTTSLAAMLLTAPWIAHVFGTWSNVAVLANVIVVPVSNLMLLGGGIIVALSYIWSVGASILASLLQWVVDRLVQYVQWCANLPYSYVTDIDFTLPAVIGVYTIIILIIWLRPSQPS